MVEKIGTEAQDFIELSKNFPVERILRFGVVVIFLWLLRLFTLKIVWRFTEDAKIRYHWRKTSTYILGIISVIILTNMWIQEDAKSLATFLGLLSAGIAIALKDMVANFAGWLFIVWRRPLAVGDRIQIGEHAGDVIDIRVFQFTLMEIGNRIDAEQSTGRIIQVPNGKIFNEVLANYSRGFQYIWNEVPVLLTFESDWKKAKSILFEIARKDAEHLTKEAEQKVKEASRKYMIFYNNLTPTVYTSVKDSGVLLTIRYLSQPRRKRSSEQSIWEDILDEFSKHQDIDFAYPTQRFYNHPIEGKQGNNRTPNEE